MGVLQSDFPQNKQLQNKLCFENAHFSHFLNLQLLIFIESLKI